MWPVEWPEPIVGGDPTLVAVAERYAVQSLTLLTLGRVGGGLITVMPCGSACRAPLTQGFYPYMRDGKWYNCWCQSGCDCASMPTVFIPGLVYVDNVVVDDVVLDPSAYRVIDHRMLQRVDGGSWPSCAGDSFRVTYSQTHPADGNARRAAGVLATEFYRMLTQDRACRLPRSITSIQRQGISMELTPGVFPDGLTGIPEVDTFVKLWNPHGLTGRIGVYSPDLPRHRQITWGA